MFFRFFRRRNEQQQSLYRIGTLLLRIEAQLDAIRTNLEDRSSIDQVNQESQEVTIGILNEEQNSH